MVRTFAPCPGDGRRPRVVASSAEGVERRFRTLRERDEHVAHQLDGRAAEVREQFREARHGRT